MRRDELGLAVVVAVVVFLAAAALPALVEARPAYEIPVHEATDGESLDRVDGEGWSEAPPVTIPTSSAGAAVPAADNTTVERVSVAAARTDERLYLRLSWEDGTRDVSNEDTRMFSDAAAVQLPVNESERPSIAMGSTDSMVNVWYWNGAGTSEELLAGGVGTTTEFDESSLQTNASYSDGRWRVVFSRSLDSSSENRTSVPADQDMDVAFAAWNGSNMERSGQKATSEWYYLALGPGPQGPPYETILWVVAGVAIVFTTLVTVEGVRRTRGE